MSSDTQELTITERQTSTRKPKRVITKVKAEVSHAVTYQREIPDLCVIMIDNPDLKLRSCKPHPDGVAENVELMDVDIVDDVDEAHHAAEHVAQQAAATAPLPTTTVDWLPVEFTLTEVEEEFISGYVRTEAEVEAVLSAHSKYTESIFSFNSDDQYKKKKMARRLFYYSKIMNISSHITSSDRNKIYVCSYGLKYRTKEREEPYCQYSKVVAKEGKPVRRCISCPAKIVINELSVYTEYPLEGLTKKQKHEQMSNLRDSLSENYPVSYEKYHHLKLPLKNAHRGHVVSEYHWKLGRTHPKLLKKIEELTVCGLKNVKIIQAILKKYAEDELIDGNIEDVKHLNYYFPTDKTIRNKMRFVTVKYKLKELHGSETKRKAKSGKTPPKRKKREKEKEREFYQYEDYRIQ